MGDKWGFPYFEVQFTKDGLLHDPNEEAALIQFLDSQPVTDLLFLSYGWNNDFNSGRSFYDGFIKNLRDVLDNHSAGLALTGRKIAIVAIFWPSKKFAEKELIPGGGVASVGGSGQTKELEQQLDNLKGFFDAKGSDAKLKKAKALLPRLDTDPAARLEFVRLLRSTVKKAKKDEIGDNAVEFFNLPGDQVLERLNTPLEAVIGTDPQAVGGAAALDTTGGLDAGIAPTGGTAGFFSSLLDGATNFVNYLTYYQMKERAGVVGSAGVYQLLSKIHTRYPGLKIHLAGHSFGGRLVSAAATGPNGQAVMAVNSVILLQAAFSHYGFASNYEAGKNGFFRRLVTEKRVSGPMLITHTKNDWAVGVAYPLASMVAGQVAAGLGDENDKFGGIGRNGAQRTPEAQKSNLLAVGSPYQFQPGNMYNLLADPFISSHEDVSNPTVMYLILSAIAST